MERPICLAFQWIIDDCFLVAFGSVNIKVFVGWFGETGGMEQRKIVNLVEKNPQQMGDFECNRLMIDDMLDLSFMLNDSFFVQRFSFVNEG